MQRKSTILILIFIFAGSMLANMEKKIVTTRLNVPTKRVVKKHHVASLELQKNITGIGLSSKSVVHSGTGLFFAQNMMYSHNISVYNRQFERVKIIKDAVDLSKFGYKDYPGLKMGAPVECAFSNKGLYAWVSNYQMYGEGFDHAGEDNCKTSNSYDPSFLYKINTQTLSIENIIQVGAVPKYVAVTPDSRFVLVSNWCSGDVTIINSQTGEVVKSVAMGSHPRGLVVDSASEKVYVAVMGSSKIGVINLKDFSVSRLSNVVSTPRHLCISPDNNYLYVTLNSEGKVAKIDLHTGKTLAKVRTGRAPRSMAISGNGAYLYVVNYLSNTLSKINAGDMKVVETVATKSKPIGITTDVESQNIWVACYSGNIMVFHDSELNINNLLEAKKFEETKSNAVDTQSIATTTVSVVPKTIVNENFKTKTATQKVEEKFINKTNRDVTISTAKNIKPKGYHIIVESSTDRSQAQRMLVRWKAEGLNKAQLITAGKNYRVATNFFKTKAEADQALAPIKIKYKQDAWIWEH